MMQLIENIIPTYHLYLFFESVTLQKLPTICFLHMVAPGEEFTLCLNLELIQHSAMICRILE